MYYLVLSSGGGESFVVGALIAILAAIFIWLKNKSKPVRNMIATEIKLQVNPNDIGSIVKKGYAEIRANKLSSAMELFQKAVNLSHNNLDALAGIAYAYHLSKDYHNSKTAIEEYLKNIDPNNFDYSTGALVTYLNGHHFFMENKLEEAQNCKQNANKMSIFSEDIQEIITNLNLY
ncbi:tetratricopeptide repeat protein [Petrimonas sp.]|uniref:tetratricopeptide repeat protein n=1 Tax=Petrimonas sp. TaxID=2023866 RepID=UPI002FC8DA2C